MPDTTDREYGFGSLGDVNKEKEEQHNVGKSEEKKDEELTD